MTDHKAKNDDGKGIPSTGEQKTAETTGWDKRLFPGGSPEASETPEGMAGLDKDAVRADERVLPGVKSNS
jgi:hypothetical protein